MSFVNKLDPSSAAFIPDPNVHSEAVTDYMGFFTDFSASFPDIGMNVDPCVPEPCPQKQDNFPSAHPAGQRQHDPSAFGTPGITLEKVQMDMYIAINSFIQLQNEYQAKLGCVERELAKNVEEASNLRQDVNVLSNWAKAVLDHFQQEGTTKDAKVVSQDQNSVL
ncbi:hypothetical protein BU25DRAFT_444974 [Macroventuria anomochaeta]|uniref:Uncharacterized protein n=1 Tax=Macroventuria anomochaeta TaxID=301207 RepID=A0ACB6SFD3_9PLEO|nr:uncharacterized protein BU25DRAFT_444974 [Macroventuria anomochaeta]KAF2633015.1 hypothetical protein BU25DRAFT_444974 [Macroventuria anomochaeta]